MRISLLDPGLQSILGHHFDLDLRLARALECRGYEVSVHGAIDLSPALQAKASVAGLDVRPCFSVSTYQAMPGESRLRRRLRKLLKLPSALPPAIDAYRAWTRRTAEELSDLPDADLWFWPTLAPYQFAAAAMSSRTTRQAGGLWWQPSFPIEIGAHCWNQAARQVAKNGVPFVIGAYDELIASACRSFSPQLDVSRLPCPHDGTLNLRQPKELKRIGFFGHQRPDRGIDLVPGLVNALLDRGFTVVIQDSGLTLCGGTPHPRLEILPFIDDFPAELARCDAVIWPSRWQAYRQSYSGVVAECIASGVPVILPAGCLPANVATRFACGTFFCDYSQEAILEAVEELAAGFTDAWSKARTAADAWRSENGSDRLAHWLDTLIKGEK